MFDHLDAVLLARIQFAFTASFHFIFHSFSIGLAGYLAALEGLWLRTGKPVYLDLSKYWLKIFAVMFAMGVVSGIVMSCQFGTNWLVFAVKAGPVLGPLMAYDVLMAFFLEAGPRGHGWRSSLIPASLPAARSSGPSSSSSPMSSWTASISGSASCFRSGKEGKAGRI